MKPLRSNIIIEPIIEEDVSPGGIVMNKKKDITTGTVLSTGPKVIDIKTGDKILFSKYAPIKIEGESTLMIKEENVHAVIE